MLLGTREASERPQPLARLRGGPSSLCTSMFLCPHSILGEPAGSAGWGQLTWAPRAHRTHLFPPVRSMTSEGVSATSHPGMFAPGKVANARRQTLPQPGLTIHQRLCPRRPQQGAAGKTDHQRQRRENKRFCRGRKLTRRKKAIPSLRRKPPHLNPRGRGTRGRKKKSLHVQGLSASGESTPEPPVQTGLIPLSQVASTKPNDPRSTPTQR